MTIKSKYANRLTLQQRQRIAHLLKRSLSYREIAKALGVSHVTILNEMKRCAGEYNAYDAHLDMLRKSKHRCAVGFKQGEK